MPGLLRLIGIGLSPEHVTAEAAAAIHDCDVLFLVDKDGRGNDLTSIRQQVCERYARHDVHLVTITDPTRDRDAADYRDEVERWHDRRADAWERALAEHLPEYETGGFLVWGDPALYDSTLRVLDRVRTRGRVALRTEVIAGVNSVAVLTARHQIPLNDVGAPVLVTTGRRLHVDSPGQDTVVVMLDGGTAWQDLDASQWDIWWGAYLGMPAETLIAGPLAEVGDQLAAAKAAGRAEHGWIMDVYLLRRRRSRSGGE